MVQVYQKFNRNGKPYPEWRFRYIDFKNTRREAKGYTSKTRTMKLAIEVETEHRLIREGLRPAPAAWDRHARRPISEIIAEYMAWGCAQGGRRGFGWSPDHREKKQRHLDWWTEQLNLSTLHELDGCLPRVESAMRESATGKTAANRVEALQSFCRWCIKRNYLRENPLAGMAPFNRDPQSKRRALTPVEVERLYQVAPPWRRLLYETALASGLRKNELRSLSIDDLDIERSGLILHAEWTKDRLSGFQPIPSALVGKLAEFAGQAAQLYERDSRKRKTPVPDIPLLFVPEHVHRRLNEDIESAGIQKQNFHGRIDFHALRVTYCTGLFAGGTDIKTAMALARHKTPDLTLHTYARTDDERMRKAADKVGEMYAERHTEATQGKAKKAAGAETVDIQQVTDSRDWWRRGELNPRPVTRQ